MATFLDPDSVTIENIDYTHPVSAPDLAIAFSPSELKLLYDMLLSQPLPQERRITRELLFQTIAEALSFAESRRIPLVALFD